MREQEARSALLLGEEGMKRLNRAYVAVFGLGGVGGHCVEALARAGIGRLHLVDADVVEPSNLNRQLVATKNTLGLPKTQAMAQRIEEVADCALTLQQGFVLPENVERFLPEGLSFIVDAVDTVSAKLALVKAANEKGLPIISCMGAGNRLDPTAFYITDLFATQGCGLARVMRRELRKMGIGQLDVVCSREPAGKPCMAIAQTGKKRQTPGSIAPVTAAAGLALAGYVIRAIALPKET